MVCAETHEEDPNVNVVTRNGVATNEDKGKNLPLRYGSRKHLKTKKALIFSMRMIPLLKHENNLQKVHQCLVQH